MATMTQADIFSFFSFLAIKLSQAASRVRWLKADKNQHFEKHV
jgi:hypothetical protein